MFRSEMPTGNPESGVVSRRSLLRSAGWATIGASAAALLAACGDPELPKPAASGRTAASGSRPVTPVVAADEREATPQPGAPITIGVPTGNPLFDQVSLRVTGLAADATRTAEAPGDLSVVQFDQALSFNAAEIATAVEALLANHPQLDAVLLLNADLALLLAARGHLAAVNGPAASAPDFNSADFLPSAIDALTWDDDLFGVPLWTSVNLLQCNPELLEDAGVDLESLRDWDWDQFRDTARRLMQVDAAGNPSQWGLWIPP
ncbi:MAG: extracellular solute-binding protein, partial [Chloroflexota bacterium]|nr:extracellular solute-binding protein [Chloroflexota bacterium]